MKLCHKMFDYSLGPLQIEQRANGLFRVTYGKHVRDGLTYAEAAHEYGECILHHLACEGLLDNECD